MSNLIDEINAEQMQRELPDFSPGDTVIVYV
ncbi:MAG: 50S ribosomal protein L19, partial [Gammaproteobacteria bacterium]